MTAPTRRPARGTAGTRPAPAGRRDRRRPPAGPRTPRRPTPQHWFAERLLAVLSGRRPVHWMLGHTIGEAYEQLVELAPGSPLGPAGQAGPLLRHCDAREPADGVLEAFARIANGGRLAAMAFRLEQGRDQRWRCAAVEIGPRP
ncbi:Rv3235 family protein [Streptomyces bambusae]|nr:Rv3235 family protein [Streptomyces bambusae]MCB5169423.1 Rv3235 family protein [Streptomyces bambusae]